MNQRIRLTIQLLEEALLKLLQEKTIYDISIKELCDVAGINRSTFYKHFNSQFDLLMYMEDKFMEEIGECLKSYGQKISLNKRLIKILDLIKDNFSFTKLLLNNNIDPEFATKLFKKPDIVDVINNDNIFTYTDPKMKQYAVIFKMEGCFSVLKSWINNNCDISSKQLSEYLLTFTGYEVK